MKEQTGNIVSCDNMGALHTFAKKSKQVPASSSNADIIRALREVNRLAHNKYIQPRACERAPRQNSKS